MCWSCLVWPGLRPDSKRKCWRANKTYAQSIDEKRSREKNWKWRWGWWGSCCHQQYAYSIEVTGQEKETFNTFLILLFNFNSTPWYSLCNLNTAIESQVFQQILRGHPLEKVCKIVPVKSKAVPTHSRILSVYTRWGSELTDLSDISKPKQWLTLKYKIRK